MQDALALKIQHVFCGISTSGKRTSEDVRAPEGLPLGEPTGKPEEDEKSKDDHTHAEKCDR